MAGPNGDIGHVEYSKHNGRAYAVLAKGVRWYLGLYADYEAAAAAAQSFLLELHNSDSDHHNAFTMAALAQKAARHTCLGRHLFTQWPPLECEGAKGCL